MSGRTSGEVDFSADRALASSAVAQVAGRFLATERGAVSDAIRYSLEGEGKRLRAILVMAAYRAAGGTGDVSDLAAAVEVVHAYSLVHDDLPCMDDDAMRRGRPTVHKIYGVATAAAAGMGMVPLAARTAVEGAKQLGLPSEAIGEIVRTLMYASGACGMIGGQLLDLDGEGIPLTLDGLEQIHRRKTGALIEASVVIGGLAAQAPPALLAGFGDYGRAIGLAFQIVDDVLDITATTDQLGKTAGKDLQNQKSTYPALLGIVGARLRAQALVDEGCRSLEAQGALTSEMASLARFTISRQS